MNTSRRKILITAACALVATSGMAPADERVWRGFAMGADAEIRITGLTQRETEVIVSLASAEIERLERSFSLYRPDSELSRLNRDGDLTNPSQDFRLLLESSLHYSRTTNGCFNPAIQPVWRFLAHHFSNSSAEPDPDELARHVALCDPAGITITDDRITLAPGMALTFNGIAQGYITDRVADLLRTRGLTDILLNLGEICALPGRAWRVDIEGSEARHHLRDGAIAQSAGRGTPLSSDGRWHHLIDPENGRSPNTIAAITIAAPTATEADALSTAFFVASPDRRASLLTRFPHITTWTEYSS
jgi:FAD:protein FMN transferase